MGRPARVGLVSACLVAGGCAQLAGIDETSGGTAPGIATLTVERVSVGASLVRAPLDITNVAYLFENENAADGFDRVPATMLDTGSFTLDVGDATPAVMFTVPEYPDPITRVWQLPARDLSGAYTYLEHPGAIPAPDPAMLTVQATLPSAVAAGEGFQFVSVGTWNARGFSGAEAPMAGAGTFGPVAFAFTTMNRQTPRPYEKITTADATLLLRFAAQKLTGVMEGTPFDQTANDMVMGTMTNVTATETMTATLNNATVATRFMPPRPTMGAPTMRWQLSAAPGFAYGMANGVQLDAATVLAADPPAITTTYGNPFAAKGWETVMTWSASSSRPFTPPGAPVAANLSAGLSQVVEPTPDMVLDLPAGMPELITLGQTPLSTDGIAFPKPMKAVPATFVVPPMPANTLYHLIVIELVTNMAATAIDLKPLVTLTNVTPSFMIPPEFFQPGKVYTLRAMTHAGGYPNLDTGDLATRALPIATGFMDSGVIVVDP